MELPKLTEIVPIEKKKVQQSARIIDLCVQSSQYQIWLIWALFNLKVIIYFLLGAENAVSIGKKSLKWMFQQPKTNVNKKINLELQRLFQNLSYFYKLLLKFLIPVVGFLLPTFDLQIQYFSPIKNFPVRKSCLRHYV